MSGHKSKSFTLSFDEEEGRTLDRFMEERKQTAEAGTIGIPFGSLNLTKVTTSSSFFSHPLIPQFLLEYGSNIHRIHNSLLLNGQDEIIPLALQGQYTPPNVDFLRNCPNLRLLCLPDMKLDEYVKILTALGAYFARRNGSSWPTLTIFIEDPSFDCGRELLKELSQTEGVARLIKELAVADGRVLIDSMPITLLDEAVRHFYNQPELRSFGKCIRSLRGFSSSLYEVELPNMRKMKVDWGLLFGGRERDEREYSKTVNTWPQLREVEIRELSNNLDGAEELTYMKKLLYGNVVRPSVEKFHFDMKLQLLSSDGGLLMEKLPNLTQLSVHVHEDNVQSFRYLMRTLETSCPKLGYLDIKAFYRLGDVDFLGGENDGELPPLRKLSGKLKL
jgi:hypothetical protein